MFYSIEEDPPTVEAEVSCRTSLLAVVRDIADGYGLEMEPFTAWQEDQPERVQGIFLNTSTTNGPWCVGAAIRRNNGELRIWPRNDSSGPMSGSTIIMEDELESSILEMVEQFTAT